MTATSSLTSKKHSFRLLCDGESEWQGRAFDADDALDRAFYHETPGNSVYTLERWNGRGWFPVFSGRL